MCIIIKEPFMAERGLILPGTFGFKDLQKPSGPYVAGVVTDQQSFSRSLPVTENNITHYSCYIKAPGTDFYIPDQLEQVISAIQTGIEDHYNSGHFTSRDYCHLQVMQSFEALTGRGIHIDASYWDMLAEEAHNHHSYIIYDVYPTHFIDQPFHIDTFQMAPDDVFTAKGDERITQQFGQQAQNVMPTTFAPFSVVHFDSTAVHQASALQKGV